MPNQQIYDLVNEITVQLATNQPLTKIVLKAAEAGYSIALIPATEGNPNLLRVLLTTKDEENPFRPVSYAHNHIDMGMMAEYLR